MTALDLLTVFGSRDNYARYRKYVKEKTIDKTAQKVLKDLGAYFDSFVTIDEVDWSQFKLWFTTVRNPKMGEEETSLYSTIFDRLSTYGMTPVAENVLDYYIKLDYATQALDMLYNFVDGDNTVTIEDVQSVLEAYTDSQGVSELEADDVVTDDFTKLFDEIVRHGGVEWGLEDLNVGIGPVHEGDFIIVFARPETGKTTFITDELTHMVPQEPDLDRGALIFNNEEGGDKIRMRLYQSALGKSLSELEAQEATVMADYEAVVGRIDRIKVIDRASISIGEVEHYIKKYKPRFVAFNVLDKIKGFSKSTNDVERLKNLHQWAREVAKKYKCTVFAVAQADATAEDQQWIYQNQYYGSKTGAQGEADVMIGIGCLRDPTKKDLRYFHISKNKLPGGPRSDPDLKHGYFEVAFDGQRGVYKTIGYK